MAKAKKDYVDTYKAENKKKQKTFEKILKDLNKNPKYAVFFDKYNVNSIEKFKLDYARYKTDSLFYAEILKKVELEEMLEYQDKAVECLWEIQYFKLFQIICQWHAKEIDIPGIKYCHDFYYWQMNIEKCSFLPPITKAEVDVYLDYLDQATDKEIFYFEWGGITDLYEEMRSKEEWRRKHNHPYYNYMIALIGTEFMEKPDIRGDKEKRFEDAAREQSKIDEAIRATDTTIDRKPFLSFHTDEQLEEFVTRFGYQKYLDYKKIKYELAIMFGDWGGYDKAIDILKEAGDDWPIDADVNYQSALINAANQYTKRKVMKVLPKVYKDYQFRISNGIEFQAPHSRENMKSRDSKWYERVSLMHLKKGMDFLGEKFIPD